MSQPTPETGAVQTLEVTAQFEEIVQNNIDIDRFEAVAEHDGSIQRLVERYGDDPGTCPYIKSMGAAGVELVQKLAAAESNPERGPTMRELMEAKKKQAQVSDVTTEKPKPIKTLDTPETKVAGRRPDEKPNITVNRVNASETMVAHEHVARIIETALSKEGTVASKVVMPVEVPVKPVGQRQELVTDPHSEAPTKRQLIDLDACGVLEIERAHQAQSILEKNIDAKTTVAIEPIIRTNPIGSVRRQTIKTIKLGPLPATNTAETLVDRIKQDTVIQVPYSAEISNACDEQPIVDVIADFEEETETDPTLMSVEYEGFDFETLLAELGLQGYVPEATSDTLAEEPTETSFADLGSDTEPIMAETLDVNMISKVLDEEITTQEIFIAVDLQEELGAYIQLLEPNKAETAQITLVELVKAIQDVRELEEPDTEEIIVTTEEIKQLLTQVLELLGLDDNEQTVKKIMQTLLSPAILEELNEKKQLTIDQLNYMGTREHTSNSIISIFTSLLQMIKDKVKPHLRIGSCALSASLVY
jgi:hypothetical protein